MVKDTGRNMLRIVELWGGVCCANVEYTGGKYIKIEHKGGKWREKICLRAVNYHVFGGCSQCGNLRNHKKNTLKQEIITGLLSLKAVGM